MFFRFYCGAHTRVLAPTHRSLSRASFLALSLLLASACASDSSDRASGDWPSKAESASDPASVDNGAGADRAAGSGSATTASSSGAKAPVGLNAGNRSSASVGSAPTPSAGGSTSGPTTASQSSTLPSSVAVLDAGTVAQPVTTTPPTRAAVVNPFVDTSKDPFSTFGADVDTASYDYLRQGLQTYGTLPQPEYVRVEDYVNFFKYAYPVPAADAVQPFSIALAATPHPLGRSTTLVRVGIQAKAAPVADKKPANLIFLVDVSGSMASADKLPLVKRVLQESLGVLAPTDKISIVTYAADTRVRLGPTPVSSRDVLLSTIDALEVGGGTNGASGINLAYEQASAGFIQGGINQVILCTDGDFNIGVSSNAALVQLIKDKRATGVTLTALGFGRGNLNDSMMEMVADAGNGIYSIIYSEDQAVQFAHQRLLSSIIHVAKDMKIQVEFNPTLVLAYRLMGYEDRAIADVSFRDDKVDGGEVGAEHRVTALYEVVLSGGQVPLPAGVPPLSAGETSDVLREIDPSELVRVKVRSKPVTATDADPATEVVAALKPADVLASTDPDLAWAAAIASFAEVLRLSPYVVAGELDAVSKIVTAQQDRDSDRSEFATLLTKARGLLGK